MHKYGRHRPKPLGIHTFSVTPSVPSFYILTERREGHTLLLLLLCAILQFHLNGGRPVAQSVPATEHSVMTSWPNERAAIENMIDNFGTGVYSIVMDSYDYAAALSEV
jgi:hypothetical protein